MFFAVVVGSFCSPTLLMSCTRYVDAADLAHAVLITTGIVFFADVDDVDDVGDVDDGIRQAAREVSDFLGTVHHGYEYTVQEGLDAIREVRIFLRRLTWL